MRISVADACAILEQRGLLKRHHDDHGELIVDYVHERLGRDAPPDLQDFYRERIAQVADFRAIAPVWNDWVGWRPVAVDTTKLLGANAVPIFSDGCGSLFGLDLSGIEEVPPVYFFDYCDGYEKPHWAAGSSLGVFMLLLADKDRAHDEGWPRGWELEIDPDISKCSRAPPIWLAG